MIGVKKRSAVDFDEALEIYHNPKGHSKEECRECIELMNRHSKPKPTSLQLAALLDANLRLIALNKEVEW